MPHVLKEQEVSMLGAEIEMLMKGRQSLLRISDATAVFIANLDSSALPKDSYEAAEMLSNSLNDLSEETLRDALEKVKAELTAGK